MADETIVARLELVAALARTLADDYKAGKLWPGDLSRGLDNIEQQIARLRSSGEGRRG